MKRQTGMLLNDIPQSHGFTHNLCERLTTQGGAHYSTLPEQVRSVLSEVTWQTLEDAGTTDRHCTHNSTWFLQQEQQTQWQPHHSQLLHCI